MYSGSVRNADGSITGWSDIATEEWSRQSVFAIKQDTKLLGEFIVRKGGQFLKELVASRDINPSSITYFLPHLSSQYFGPKIDQEMRLLGLDFPLSKWFTNLSTVGNVGAGSAYLMLEELFHSGRLKKGDTLLMMVPESARFNYAYIMMTVV
jgi:3-oxoacyl-[acyl-carrier-protein] synthase-3